MRTILLGLILAAAACGGPSQQQLAETPTATLNRPGSVSLAPPASDSDEQRYRLNDELESQRDAAQAYREASAEASAPPPVPPGARVPEAPPPPAEESPSTAPATEDAAATEAIGG